MIFKFGGQLQPVEIEEWEAERSPCGVCDGCTTRRGNACKGGDHL